MWTRSFVTRLFAVGMGFFLAGALARADDLEGVTVLGRGPVHEAFAQPTEGAPQPLPLIPREPPAAVEEVPPDQKPEGDGVQWIPGYWQWDEDRGDFIWVSGVWRKPPPQRHWVPGHWNQVNSGFQWAPGFWKGAAEQELAFLPAPPATLEEGPAVAVPANSLYVPGTWLFREGRYRWRPGYVAAYQAGWVWVPSRYVWTPAGYVFVDGYWDYTLEQRGLLFAPVAFSRVAFRPGFTYVPRYAVPYDFLPTALFVRAGWGQYYFGDYFGPTYARVGFTPFFNYRVGRYAFDPLFGYYSLAYANRGWAGEVRTLYTARVRGTVPLPPRTLVQQTTLVRNITVNKTVTVPNVVHVTPLVSLNQVRPVPGGARLVTVSPAAHLQVRQTAQQYTQVVQERRTLEKSVVREKAVTTQKTTEVARVARWKEVPAPAVRPRGVDVHPAPHPWAVAASPAHAPPPVPHTHNEGHR